MAARKHRIGITLGALVSIFFGTLFAVLGVPSNLSDSSALFEPTLFMTIGLLLPIALQLRLDLRDILRVENLVMLGLVYWLMLDMLQSAYPFEFVTKSDVQWGYIAVGIFGACVWLGASGKGWRIPNAIAKCSALELSNRTLFSALLIAFVLGMGKFAIGAGFDPILMIKGLGSNRWDAPWSRGQFGGLGAISEHLQYFGYVVPSLTILLAVRQGWFKVHVVLGLILSIIMVAFLAQGGGRRVIGVAFGAALFTWVAARPTLRPQLLIFGVPAVFGILVLLQEMLRYRNVGFSSWWRGERPELHVQHLHVDDNFLRLTQLISFYPERVDFVYFQPIYHALTLPVPRFLWPGKPNGPGFDLPLLLGKQGVSLSSSLLGELWVSLGVVGIIVGGIAVGRLSGMWNKILLLPYGTSRPLIYGLGLMVVFAGLRSMQAMVQMSYIVLAWIVVSSFLAKPKLPRSNGHGL